MDHLSLLIEHYGVDEAANALEAAAVSAETWQEKTDRPCREWFECPDTGTN